MRSPCSAVARKVSDALVVASDVAPQSADETFEQQRSRRRRVEAARRRVKELLGVEFADRRAMRALDVVGEDLEFGLGVGGGAAVEQHRLDRLDAVGLLPLRATATLPR